MSEKMQKTSLATIGGDVFWEALNQSLSGRRRLVQSFLYTGTKYVAAA